MAKQVSGWLDNRGHLHETEAQAKERDVHYAMWDALYPFAKGEIGDRRVPQMAQAHEVVEWVIHHRAAILTILSGGKIET